MTPDLVWQELPPRGHRWSPPTRTVHAELMTEPDWVVLLRLNPGRWAVLQTYPSPWTAGKQADLWEKRYGIEATTRKQTDGTYAVYGRA